VKVAIWPTDTDWLAGCVAIVAAVAASVEFWFEPEPPQALSEKPANNEQRKKPERIVCKKTLTSTLFDARGLDLVGGVVKI
jgi:hypothetical protein